MMANGDRWRRRKLLWKQLLVKCNVDRMTKNATIILISLLVAAYVASNVLNISPYLLTSTAKNKKQIESERQIAVYSQFMSNSSLPSFYKDYFVWHAQQMQGLKKDPSNWESKRYLIMECLSYFSSKDNRTHWGPCGGLSDRLTPIPLLVWTAYRTKRILFIQWNRPFPLEEFLEPASILDWRLPRELASHLHSEVPTIINEQNAYATAMTSSCVVRSKLQMPGEDTFRKKLKLDYENVFHDLWREMFRPVPRLQAKIDAQLAAHDLKADNYAATHVRAVHAYRLNSNEIVRVTYRALRCTTELMPGAPILVASDSKEVYDVARNISLQFPDLTIVALKENDFIHFDYDLQWESRKPEEYDSAFQDLYMIGSAKCTSYGVGGYGKFGSRMTTGASTCGFDYNALPRLPCEWTFV